MSDLEGTPLPASGWFDRRTMLAGARAILPLSAAAFAFGLAYGVVWAIGCVDLTHHSPAMRMIA